MQASNSNPGPSSISQESNSTYQTQRIEAILRNIDRYHLLAEFRGRPDFVWDDTLIPYGKNQLPKVKRDYRDRFMEEQKRYLLGTSQQILDKLDSDDKGAPPHLSVLDIDNIFDIGDKLGDGTFGTVFKVTLPRRDSENADAPSRTFAMKRFPKSLQGQTENTLRSFKTERDNLERSEKEPHQHLISYHASFTDEAYFGFITSPVAESNLKSLLEKFIKDKVIPKDESESLCQAFRSLLEAVHHLHKELKMRHCDLKPSNILICGRLGSHFSVKICDLGISHAWNFPQDDSTNKNQRGTQRYKAPELSPAQDRSHNRMVDIFSLGCIFLEMLTVVRGRTLDGMAQAINQDPKSSFAHPWAYAGSLKGIEGWLEELHADTEGLPGAEFIGLITNMLHEDRKDRKEAEELLKMIPSHQYVNHCCRRELAPALPTMVESQSSQPASNPQRSESLDIDDGTMEYETSWPFKKCTIKSRKSGGDSNNYTTSEYECLQDFPQGGEVEIGKTVGRDAWATTRWVQAKSHPHTQAKQWLPGYYVQARQEGTQVSFKWSNCDHLNQKARGRQQARLFEKVHRRAPNESNLLMEIDFCKDSRASKFCQLLLEDPFKPKAPVAKVQTPDQKSLVIHECKWKCETEDSVENGGRGSLVVCSQHLEQPTFHEWLEPFFVPYDFDFSIALQNDQKHAQLSSKYLWVPMYRSNIKDRYEEPKERGIFDKVELVQLRDGQTFNFEADFETGFMPRFRRREPVSGNNESCSLRRFLKYLTDWDLLAIFFDSKVVLHHHRWSSSDQGSCDVLCFQKGKQKRIAIRKENGDDKNKIEWITAKLVDLQVNTKTETLEAQLNSVERGRLLTLASVTAAAGETHRKLKKLEKWSFNVKHGAADIHHAVVVSEAQSLVLAQNLNRLDQGC